MEDKVLFMEGFSQIEGMAKDLLEAWPGLKIDRCAKISECVRTISSGRYKAIVVDLDNKHTLFEKELGVVLQDFVRAGGVIAFPTIEGFTLAPTLKRLFNTTWEAGNYGREMWGVCNENYNTVTELFGDLKQLESLPFSARVASVKNVPQHEQCFIIVSEDSEEQDAGDVYAKEVSVAVHRYGHGSIAFFGDVNYETETAQLVAAYVRSRVSGPAPGF